ncbi:MAG TPA: hypothetical protein VGC54_03680 [Planctomycetota bacterium]
MHPAFLALLPAVLAPAQDPGPAAKADAAPVGRATVYRVDRIETLDGEAMESATLVVRQGVIEALGKAVVVPTGAVVHDLRGGGSTLMPPYVLTHANWLQSDSRGNGRNARFLAADSLWLDDDALQPLREHGVLLVGVDPPGSGLPGRTSVLDADAAAPQPRARVRDLHLKVELDSNNRSKELLRKALEDADKAIEKEAKARTDWEKARKDWDEKQKKAAADKAAKDEKKPAEGGEATPKPGKDEGGDDKSSGKGKDAEEKAPPETFEPPTIEPDLVPVVEWVRKQRVAQIWVDDAAAWLHLLDVLGERELPWELVAMHSSSTNLHEVLDALEKRGERVYLPARLSFLPFTRTRLNLPAELAARGVPLVLLPPATRGPGGFGRSSAETNLHDWRAGVSELVRGGLDRGVALRAITLEAAAAIGQEEHVAALVAGGPATFVILDGDPLDATAEVQFLLREGKVLYDRAKEEKEERR